MSTSDRRTHSSQMKMTVLTANQIHRMSPAVMPAKKPVAIISTSSPSSQTIASFVAPARRARSSRRRGVVKNQSTYRAQ